MLRIPTLGEILDFGEERYFANISSFVAKPFTYMAMLDDMGIDYEKISDFELFLRLAPSMDYEIIPFLFGDTLPLSTYCVAHDNVADEMVLVNPDDQDETFTPFDLKVIADTLRQIHFYKEETRKAGNEAAKEFLIERAKRKAARAAQKPYEPFLEPRIVALVNAPEFPYTYETARTLTIYQFMCSLVQIPRRIHYDNVMHGLYVGMIDGKQLNLQELDWLNVKLKA